MRRSGVTHAPLLLPCLRASGARPHGTCWRVAAEWALLGLLALLAGCTPKTTVQPILSEQCLQLGGQRQEITVDVPVRGTGLLHIAIRERGISATAEIISGRGAGERAAAPMGRWGEITLAENVDSSRRSSVRVDSVDSPQAAGDLCISAELIQPVRGALAQAVRLSFRAGIATLDRRWQQAFDDYLQAARLYDDLAMPSASADARTAMAELAHRYLRRDRDSSALLGIVISGSTSADPETLGSRLALLARTLIERTDSSADRAQRIDQLLRRSVELFHSSVDGARELPWIGILEGFLRYRNQELGASRKLFEESAEGCVRVRDSECLARARQNLAAIAEDQQNYPEALANYEAALSVLDDSRATMLAADISDNLGRLEGRIGLIRRGEAADRAAMRLYARLADCDGARRAASTLGEMLASIGSIGEATIYLNLATSLGCRDLLSSLAKHSSETIAAPVETFRPSSHAAMWNASNDVRICSVRPPLRDLTLDGDVAVFHALLAGSEVAQLENQLADAARCLELARDFAATDVRSQIRLASADGQLSLRRGLPAEAEDEFERALNLADSADLSESSDYRGTALLGLADALLETRNLPEAMDEARSALQLSSARADVSRLVASLQLIASIDRRSGRSDDAEKLLRCAIRLIEQVPTRELDPETRAMYLATQHAVYADLTGLLAHETIEDRRSTTHSAWDAFAVADEGHARSLRFALDQSFPDGSSAGDGGGAARGYRELMRRIAQLASASSQGSRREELLRRVQELSLTVPVSRTFDRRELAGTLREMNATLVEYAVGRDSLFAFVVDGQHIQIVELGDLEAVERAAGEFITLLRSPEPEPMRIRVAARRLAQQVLWPVTPYIRHERVLLVPDDALHTVPFAALPWTQTDPRDLALRHAELSVLPSALIIERQAADATRTSNHGRFVLIGDPVLRSTIWTRTCAESNGSAMLPYVPFDWMKSLPSLPGTRDEVLALARLVRQSHPSASVLTLLGCAATPAALRADAPGAELLHIATHGLVDARRPRLSALVLTPDSKPVDDGAVQLPDILGMRLRARLVVLSACDTSSGRLLPGEGVLGLAQAFLESGAESVVASYWRVEDSKTGSFMEAFYRHLLLDRLPAAAALRQAQLDEAQADDYNWAAFALYGNPDAAL